MMETSLVDRYLATFQFSEVHACVVAAEPARAIQAAADYRPTSDWFFRAMIGLREGPMQLLRLVTGNDQARPAPFSLDDFAVLERRADALAYGLIGKFWRLDYGLHPVADGADFIAFNGPDAAKLVFGFSASRRADGRTRLVTETRVFCPNSATYLKFLPYWLLIRPVSGLIRRRILSSIKTQSEMAGAS